MGPIIAERSSWAWTGRATTDDLLLHRRLHGIFDVLDLVELDVHQVAADLLDAPDVDGLDDVARLGVDGDWAPRALPRHPLGGVDEALPVGLAAGLLQRLVDEVHAVVAAHR